MKLIAAYEHSTGASALKRLQTWALCGVVALAGLLGAGQALAASSPPFVDNGDGTVTDTSTGLMWRMCGGMPGQSNTSCPQGATSIPWSDALREAQDHSRLNSKGYADWRLPSVMELMTLVKGTTPPTIDTVAFPGLLLVPPQFWTASTYESNLNYAWAVNFSNGSVEAAPKDGSGVPPERYQFRLVRSAQNSGSFGVRSGQHAGSFGFGLFPVGVSGTTVSAATLTATSPAAATGYWLVVPRNAQPPRADQIIAGATSYANGTANVTVAAKGSGAMVAKTPATLALAGLAPGTEYDLYMVAKDSTHLTISDVSGPVPFSTLTISTSAIVIDPVTPSTLYAGLDGAGVYKKIGAGNWAAANSSLGSTQRVKALLIKPGTSGATATLFAATYGNGVFKSTDAAATWSACNTASLGNLNVLSLGMNASASTLYAGTEAGVFVSDNDSDCGSWAALNTGMP